MYRILIVDYKNKFKKSGHNRRKWKKSHSLPLSPLTGTYRTHVSLYPHQHTGCRSLFASSTELVIWERKRCGVCVWWERERPNAWIQMQIRGDERKNSAQWANIVCDTQTAHHVAYFTRFANAKEGAEDLSKVALLCCFPPLCARTLPINLSLSREFQCLIGWHEMLNSADPVREHKLGFRLWRVSATSLSADSTPSGR